MRKGDVITKEHIRRIRPGFGLAPKYFDSLVGEVVFQDIKKGTATEWNLISE
jgi:N-acetylneuraminate synthase